LKNAPARTSSGALTSQTWDGIQLTRLLEMKSLLLEFVDWLENCHFRRAPCGSPFEDQIAPVLLMKAEIALNWARTSHVPVELFTTTVSAMALLAGLVSNKSRLSVESVFRGELDDGAFERLTTCLSEIRRSGLILLEGCPPPAVARTCFFGGPLFGVLMA
jgi:hypothetical protein